MSVNNAEIGVGAPLEENVLYATSFFDKLEELEEYVDDWGMAEGHPKEVLYAGCYGRYDINKSLQEIQQSLWELDKPFTTAVSIPSMLEMAWRMNPDNNEVPEFVEVIVKLDEGFILTACFDSDPRVLAAGGASYKVVIENVGLQRRIKLANRPEGQQLDLF